MIKTHSKIFPFRDARELGAGGGGIRCGKGSAQAGQVVASSGSGSLQ